jgi:hypothetical protein
MLIWIIGGISIAVVKIAEKNAIPKEKEVK